MPYADTIATVRSWSEDRAIAVWTLFAGDLPAAALVVLGNDLEQVRKDGAFVVLVVPDEMTPTPVEQLPASTVLSGTPVRLSFNVTSTGYTTQAQLLVPDAAVFGPLTCPGAIPSPFNERNLVVA